MYRSWNSPIALVSWIKTSDPCQPWDSIFCEGGVVTSINGPTNGVTQPGPIAPQLSQLTGLTAINLNNLGNLTGGIPEQMSVLTSLAYLALAGNGISGSSIPRQLSTLIALSHLDLNLNALTGSVPDQLSTLTRLTKLAINGNQLSGSLPPALSAVYAKCTNANFQVSTNHAMCGPKAGLTPAFPNIITIDTGLDVACTQKQGKPCIESQWCLVSIRRATGPTCLIEMHVA